jgi:hypothetical protein
MSNLSNGTECQSCLYERVICQQEGKCLADLLFDTEDLLDDGESLQDYYEELNDYLDGTMNV